MAEVKDIGNIAVLIDVENISPKYNKHIFDELSNFGVVTYKRAYTDWTSELRVSWKQELLEYAITPIQQYSYTSGKNSTDSALIIDAMDIMYAKNVGGFCIVSSDSDFIRLVTRLREEGMYVIGMGEQKTTKDTVAAYDKFVYLDVLFGKENGRRAGEVSAAAKTTRKTMKIHADKDAYQAPGLKKHVAASAALPPIAAAPTKVPSGFLEEIISVIEVWSNVEGWANLANVGNMLSKRNPDFDSRNYGFKKLNDMIKTIPELEMQLDAEKKICYVRVIKKENKQEEEKA